MRKSLDKMEIDFLAFQENELLDTDSSVFIKIRRGNGKLSSIHYSLFDIFLLLNMIE